MTPGDDPVTGHGWKMHDRYAGNDRLSDWDALLAGLRRANSRRPRMIEVLERRKIMPERSARS